MPKTQPTELVHEAEPVPQSAVALRQPMGGVPALSNPMDVIAYAIDHKVDPATMKELLVIRQQLKAEAAKEAFDQAMAELQAEMPPIVKNKAVESGGQKMYSYCPFEDIIAHSKPYLEKHSFSYALDTDVESKDGWVIAKCEVIHRAGHSKISIAKFPLGAGTRLMSATQVFAAALTFASRRVYCNAFGIVTAGEDMDGRTTRPKPQGPSKVASDSPELDALRKELWAVTAPIGGTEKSWAQRNQWLIDECVIAPNEEAPKFTAEKFQKVIAAVKAKLQK